MTPAALLLQIRPADSVFGLITGGTWSTRLILIALAAASVASAYLIFHKWRQFREVRQQGDRFLTEMEKAQRLSDAYKAILALPESPYGRVFRQGVNFFSELRPGALRESAAPTPGLSLTQLEALRLVLEKEEAEERDEMARGLQWLAIIGSVSPLMGLLGTVIGIMHVFLDITAGGGSNIMAVAPGVGQALITTVAGLFVAIPAVIAYNHFVSELNLVSGELEGFSAEFIGTLAREGRV